MRPRPDAAENPVQTTARRSPVVPASMRPRPDAAENRGLPVTSSGAARRFNEAAARCRGKPEAGRSAGARGRAASMRPRPDAAENRRSASPPARPCARFNEAAARCRGKPRSTRRARGGNSRFNEAAARCRGKPPRPRPAPTCRPRCFNEAAARCRGKPCLRLQRDPGPAGLQ